MGSTRERARPRRTKPRVSNANVLVYERRLLMGVTIFTLFGCLLWLIAISTDYWYLLRTPSDDGVYVNATGNFFVRAHGGLWRVCRTVRMNVSETNEFKKVTTCNYHQLFPTTEEVGLDPKLDHTLVDYTRTQTAFSIISLLLMFMGHGFSVYTFREHRYMYKRLAGGVHFLTAATTLVVIEVLVNSVRYASNNLKARIPTGTSWHYGFSYYLSWITFSSFVLAGLSFLICSRKRKGDKLRSSDIHTVADEPHILGR